MKEIILSLSKKEVKVAVIEGGMLVEFYIEREDMRSNIGDIYYGRVEAVRENLKAAFVDIGVEKAAFLPLIDASYEVFEGEGKRLHRRKINPNDNVLVQVVKEPYGTKGARITTFITIPGRYVVLMPTTNHLGISRKISNKKERGRLLKIGHSCKPKKMGIILRTEAEGKDAKAIAEDVKYLSTVWRDITKRLKDVKPPALIHKEVDLTLKATRDHFTGKDSILYVDSKEGYNKIVRYLRTLSPEDVKRVKLYSSDIPIFEKMGVEKEISKIYRRNVWLKNGGYIVIDRTEAFWVIDVNSGKFNKIKAQEDMIYEINLEASKEIARQLRLRDIGGIILIDFIDMKSEKHKNALLKNFEQILKRDRAKVSLVDITQLGVVELTRTRVRSNVSSIFIEDCPYCNGKGFILSKPYLLSRIESWFKRRAKYLKGSEITLNGHPEIIKYIEKTGKEMLEFYASHYKMNIHLSSDLHLHLEDINIYRIERDREVIEEL